MNQQREPSQTRNSILEGAVRVLRTAGAGASLDAIAKESGITKGGLLYHFKNRETLLFAVAEDSIRLFRTQVFEQVDLSENHPGKLLRGYVRALFQLLSSNAETDYFGLWESLTFVEGVPELLTMDAARWRDEFLEDGLNYDRVMIVQNAAEGFISAQYLDQGITREMSEHFQILLLDLTNENGPITKTGS